MQFAANAMVIATLSLICAWTPASGLVDNPPTLAELQADADRAQPRDRCILYAELVSRMTELADQQLTSGDSAHASETLKLVQRYAEKIYMGIPDDSKKLRDAEVLVRRTSHRLEDILSEASYEDQPALEATLKQLNQIQAELMMQVFRK
jgi:hypothetical protein